MRGKMTEQGLPAAHTNLFLETEKKNDPIKETQRKPIEIKIC
jgi:hypothetical protein